MIDSKWCAILLLILSWCESYRRRAALLIQEIVLWRLLWECWCVAGCCCAVACQFPLTLSAVIQHCGLRSHCFRLSPRRWQTFNYQDLSCNILTPALPSLSLCWEWHLILIWVYELYMFLVYWARAPSTVQVLHSATSHKFNQKGQSVGTWTQIVRCVDVWPMHIASKIISYRVLLRTPLQYSSLSYQLFDCWVFAVIAWNLIITLPKHGAKRAARRNTCWYHISYSGMCVFSQFL